jgi:TatD DNase family protein
VTSLSALIDSHCHLADDRLSGDIEGIISRAQAAGVDTLVSVGAIGPIEKDRLTVQIAEAHPNVHAAVGVHPHNAAECDDRRLAQLRELAKSSRVIAIGESGLDFHYMHSPRDAQEMSLRRHLELAADTKRPIVIHCRAAETRLIEIVRETGMPPCGGVIHCFTGDSDAARAFLELGFHISFSGILTFRNAALVREAAKIVPQDRLMIETDAPYLAPEPYRGKRNEPAFMVRTLETLATVRCADSAAIATATKENTARLFGFKI